MTTLAKKNHKHFYRIILTILHFAINDIALEKKKHTREIVINNVLVCYTYI